MLIIKASAKLRNSLFYTSYFKRSHGSRGGGGGGGESGVGLSIGLDVTND